jgi:hypothetical protein
MTKQGEKDYLMTSIGEMKTAIENLNTNLSGKIDAIDTKVNDSILSIHKEYTHRITKLEESSKNQITTKILLTVLGLLGGYILNHIMR